MSVAFDPADPLAFALPPAPGTADPSAVPGSRPAPADGWTRRDLALLIGDLDPDATEPRTTSSHVPLADLFEGTAPSAALVHGDGSWRSRSDAVAALWPTEASRGPALVAMTDVRQAGSAGAVSRPVGRVRTAARRPAAVRTAWLALAAAVILAVAFGAVGRLGTRRQLAVPAERTSAPSPSSSPSTSPVADTIPTGTIIVVAPPPRIDPPSTTAGTTVPPTTATPETRSPVSPVPAPAPRPTPSASPSTAVTSSPVPRSTTTIRPVPTEQVVLYFVAAARLRATTVTARSVFDPDPRAAASSTVLGALVGAAPPDGRQNLVAVDVASTAPVAAGSTARVVLGPGYAATPEERRPLLLGQLVLSLTGRPQITSVQFVSADLLPADVVRADGTHTSGPVAASDYLALVDP